MNEMERMKDELRREKDRIVMILETERQLDALMAGIMRELTHSEEECRAFHDLSLEEATFMAKPFVQNMMQFVDVIKNQQHESYGQNSESTY